MNTEYKTFTRYFLSPKVKYNNSKRASSPFGGYREKYTREWHARGDATVPWLLAPGFAARSGVLSCAARFVRPYRRACSQASTIIAMFTL